jgi:hypothetical protein
MWTTKLELTLLTESHMLFTLSFPKEVKVWLEAGHLRDDALIGAVVHVNTVAKASKPKQSINTDTSDKQCENHVTINDRLETTSLRKIKKAKASNARTFVLILGKTNWLSNDATDTMQAEDLQGRPQDGHGHFVSRTQLTEC